MTRVAYAKIKPDSTLDALWTKVEESFPQKENEEYFSKIRKRKNQDSIKESLCALLVLAELLKKANITSSNLVLDRCEGGKPRFANSEIEFSLSHSHGYAAAVISNTSRVGIDLEATEITPERADRLAKRFFTEDELHDLNESPNSFISIWTKKEAYAKMQGIPLSDLIVIEKKHSQNKRKNVFFAELNAYSHPIAVCLETPCEITAPDELAI